MMARLPQYLSFPARVPARTFGPEPLAEAARRQAGAVVGREPAGGARKRCAASKRPGAGQGRHHGAANNISFPTDARQLHAAIEGKRCLDPTFSAGCERANVGARGAPTHVDFRAYAYVEAGPGSAAAD
jgi:hypothetical protein